MASLNRTEHCIDDYPSKRLSNMNSKFTYDVFLSYSSKDRTRVRQLAEHLQNVGLRVWFDEWIMRGGDEVLHNIEKGLAASQSLVFCMSPHSIQSDWANWEKNTPSLRSPSNHEGRFIPLLLSDCEIPKELERYKYVDYREHTDAALVALLKACPSPIEPIPQTPQPEPTWDIATQGPPYRGLEALKDQQADLFFGRGAELKELVAKLADKPFVVVVGASGAGKSSLVWAGLLPKLNLWKVGGFNHWLWKRITPAQYKDDEDFTPVKVLSAAVATALNQDYIPVKKALQAGGAEFQQLLEQSDSVLKTESDSQLLVFVDQFEELFSLVAPTLRKPFIDALDSLMATEKVRVVATMRAEFLGACMDCEAFGKPITAWFNAGQLLLAAPDAEDLQAMVKGPAKLAGLEFEAGLAEQIVKDTGLKPGNLALMAFALERLYEQREGLRMPSSAYRAFGGIDGAIADKAGQLFGSGSGLDLSIPQSKSDLLGEVFRELVEIDEHSGAATRRRMPLTIWGLGHDNQTNQTTPAQQLIKAFIEARLLLTNVSPDSKREPTLEVAHEALFRNWPLLKNWIDGRKDQFVMRKRLQRDAAEWVRRGEPDAFRWLDPLALEAGAMIRALRYQPTELETRFLGPVQREDMLALIKQADTSHELRAIIGVRLALLGDDRPGVGVKNAVVLIPPPNLKTPSPSGRGLGEGLGEGTITNNSSALPPSEGGTNSTALPITQDSLPDIVWCPVPAGTVVLEDDAGRFDVEACQIAKYPVTQAQYQLFIDAKDGYAHPRWWEGLPKRYYQELGRQIPAFANHPAVNVDWMEAMAYCRWLSQRLGKDVRLPTEWEWQQAACHGNSNNTYPWGPDWQERRCNSYESQLNRTIAVGLYAQDWPDDRPVDMAGNVWEWCLNEYAKPMPLNKIILGDSAERTLRGGSWLNPTDIVRCALRLWYLPLDRFNSLGFRLVLGSPW